VLIPLVVLAMGAVAAWGIMESVSFAALMTLVEIAGLMLVIGAGVAAGPDVVSELADAVPATLEPAVWSGILGAGLLAFFAFIGFEDIVNIAEETHAPERTLPRAIFLTLAITAFLYLAVAVVAIAMVPIDELAAAKAPLALVFERTTGASPAAISAIAIVATLNGVIAQIIMASRVIYGLARQGNLPAALGRVHAWTRSPLLATGLVTALVLVLATAFPLQGLAEATSRMALSVFALVNLSLLSLKRRGVAAPPGTFIVGAWVPALGFVSCVLLLAGGLF
jgi:amino acid transporter